MQTKVLLAVFVTLLQLGYSYDVPRCGKYHGKKSCPKMNGQEQCCSAAGYCGLTEEYCSVPGNCQSGFGTCDSDKTPFGISTKGMHRSYDASIPPLIKKCSRNSTLALTFDDGPAEHTTHVLDVLKDFDARATFFLGGIINGRGQIDEAWTPVVKRMITEGHQVGSHTWSHPNMSSISSKARKQEMYKNERAILNAIGKMPTFMRAPMVECDESCMKDMNRLGYHVVA